MKARVHVFYKESVFDPQGNAVASALRRNGFQSIEGVRMGKVIDISLGSKSREEAKRDAERMCEKLLVNPVIESYSVEVLP